MVVDLQHASFENPQDESYRGNLVDIMHKRSTDWCDAKAQWYDGNEPAGTHPFAADIWGDLVMSEMPSHVMV
jgi:hypothetical protein